MSQFDTAEAWSSFVFLAVLGLTAMVAVNSTPAAGNATAISGAMCLRFQRLGLLRRAPQCYPGFPAYTLLPCEVLPAALCDRGATVEKSVLRFGQCEQRQGACRAVQTV